MRLPASSKIVECTGEAKVGQSYLSTFVAFWAASGFTPNPKPCCSGNGFKADLQWATIQFFLSQSKVP